MQQHNYGAARRYASHALKHDTLIRDSYHAEGIYHYQAHRYTDALKAFEKYGDKSLVAKCYEALFFAEQDKLGSKLSSDTIRSHSNTIKRMANFAKKSGNKQLISHTSNLQKYL